jgi:hypothetical protein
MSFPSIAQITLSGLTARFAVATAGSCEGKCETPNQNKAYSPTSIIFNNPNPNLNVAEDN